MSVNLAPRIHSNDDDIHRVAVRCEQDTPALRIGRAPSRQRNIAPSAKLRRIRRSRDLHRPRRLSMGNRNRRKRQ